MRRVMVRYKVKPEQAAPNEALARAVYDELRATRPDGDRCHEPPVLTELTEVGSFRLFAE